VREIELTCGGRPWVFAQTLIPLATLARQRWLSSLGRDALGERLAALPALERGPLEYARLVPGDRLYHRARRERRDPPPALWARRSWFAIDGDRLLVQEVFLPESHS
jgi:chorismate--pyruvate lyase